MKIKQVITLIYILFYMPMSIASEALDATIDCSEIEVQYVDNPEWTQSERIAAMERAFFESLDRFELCNLSSSASSTSADGAGQDQGLDSADQTGENNGETGQGSSQQETVTSTKNSSMTGTEVEITQQGNEGLVNEGSDQIGLEQGNVKSNNGVPPKDIPNGNNDDVVAAQIRRAAEIEQDPVKKEKLWNEYRKYKGLPVSKND